MCYWFRVPGRDRGAMHVAIVPSRQGGREYKAYLLRQTYREAGKVKHRTLANLTALPIEAIEAVRAILRGQPVGALDEQLTIERSLPHGHVLAVLGCLRQLGLDRMLAARPRRERELVLAMIVSRVLEPASKLATTRNWHNTTLAASLGVEDADEDELYAALDWLFKCQPKVEKQLAERHLSEGGLVLYDLTSTGVEGRCCPLARIGHSRDGKRGQLQVEFGLLTDREGRPVAVEVFEGNTGDPATVASQVTKLKEQFGVQEVVLVGDRGMLTSARIESLKEVAGISWISALRSDQIEALVHSGDLQLGLFDERNLVEITSPKFPGERLVVCKNPALAEERARKREALLTATEKELEKVRASVAAGRLLGEAEIGVRVGKVIGRFKVGKHFRLEIADDRFHFERNQEQIAAEAALDGLYVIRSCVGPDKLSSEDLVRSYKLLAGVERAFRTLKSVDLQVRPVHHRLENRVRAHIFLCMLAYYVRWHLERAWAPLLFRDENKPWPEDPVAPAQRSPAAEHKARTQRQPDGGPVHSFSTLLAQLGTLTKNRLRLLDGTTSFEKLAEPTPLQHQALALLGIQPTL
jgi:Transposase DDE domain